MITENEIRSIIMENKNPEKALYEAMKNKISETINKCIFVAIIVDIILWCVTLYITKR